MERYYSLGELLELIDSGPRIGCIRILKENKELFAYAKGSKEKHHAWKGGYLDHILETMNHGVLFYRPLMETRRGLDFSLSDALLVLNLHDVEKPFKQQYKALGLEDEKGKKDNNKIKEFKFELIKKYGINLTDAQIVGIKYTEGENEDYHPFKRVQNPLAAFANMCDNWSARGFYDFPTENDLWLGAKRRTPEEWVREIDSLRS